MGTISRLNQTGGVYAHERGCAEVLLSGVVAADAPKSSDPLAVVAGFTSYIAPRVNIFETKLGGTGAFASITVLFEGSLDGATWIQLGSSTNVSGEVTWIIDRPMLYVRATVSAAAVSSGAPTMSVWFAAL